MRYLMHIYMCCIAIVDDVEKQKNGLHKVWEKRRKGLLHQKNQTHEISLNDKYRHFIPSILHTLLLIRPNQTQEDLQLILNMSSESPLQR